MTPQVRAAKLVSKLRAHADSARKIGSVAEAEAFALMVQKLMAEHCLMESDVDAASDPLVCRLFDPREFGIPLRRHLRLWLWLLAKASAECTFTTVASIGNTSGMLYYGRETNVLGAMQTYAYLLRACEHLSHAGLRENRTTRRLRLRSVQARKRWLESWRVGFGEAVLGNSRAHVKDFGVSLMRLDSIAEEARAFAKPCICDGKPMPVPKGNRDARFLGICAGSEFDLRNRQRIEAARMENANGQSLKTVHFAAPTPRSDPRTLHASREMLCAGRLAAATFGATCTPSHTARARRRLCARGIGGILARPITKPQLRAFQAMWAQRMRARGIANMDDSRELRHEYIAAATEGRAKQTLELSHSDAARLLRGLSRELAGLSIANGAAAQAAGTHGRRGYDDGREQALIGAQQTALLGVVVGRLGWDTSRLDAFVGRQLGDGSTAGSIRTMRDFNRVIWPLKRMARTVSDRK